MGFLLPVRLLNVLVTVDVLVTQHTRTDPGVQISRTGLFKYIRFRYLSKTVFLVLLFSLFPAVMFALFPPVLQSG